MTSSLITAAAPGLAPRVQPNTQSGQENDSPHSSFAWRRSLLLIAALGLAACNALTTGYNNAPTLLTWMADSYFDLDSDQETLLKERLRSLRAWHRNQLPDYARTLAEAQARLSRQVEPDDVAWLFGESEKRYRALIDHAAPAAAELAGRLRPENIAYLQQKMAKKNAEFEDDYIKGGLDKRQEKRYERMLAEGERIYGSFSREQKARIRELSDALPANYPLVLEDRKRRQAELVAILQGAVDKSVPADETTRRLKTWAGDFERGRHPAYRDFGLRYRAELQKMFATIANLATAEQRQVAVKNVQRYVDDFNNLAVASN
jgi:hypothetical protein